MTRLPLALASFALGDRAEVRVTLDTYHGKARVDIRTWADYKLGPVLTRGPTKKGVAISVADLPALVETLAKAETTARELGLIGERGCERP